MKLIPFQAAGADYLVYVNPDLVTIIMPYGTNTTAIYFAKEHRTVVEGELTQIASRLME